MDSFITEIISRREISYSDIIRVLNDPNCNKAEECSTWNKKYQSDFSRARTVKDSFFGLYDNIKDLDLTPLFINSLSRTGLIDYFSKDLKFNSFRIYKDLERFLNDIQAFDLINCLEWCIPNLDDSQQIQKCFQIFTYQIQIASTKSIGKKLDTLLLLRKFIQKHTKLNFEKFTKNIGLHSLILGDNIRTGDAELKLRAMNLFSSIYLNNQNLPIFDILQLR